MARARTKVEIEPADDEEADPTRDFVMARLAAGRSAAQSVINSIDDMLAMFVNPDEDKSGKDRRDLLETALEDAGVVCRSLEAAEVEISEVDFKQGEPWEEDEDDD